MLVYLDYASPMVVLDPNDDAALCVFVVSRGSGAAGQLLLDTLLAQFPAHSARVVCHSDQRTIEQLEHALELASEQQALLVHSLVDEARRKYLSGRAESLLRRVPVVNVTDKPLESSAHEVIELVTRSMGEHARRR